ncbi:hypothetical protein B0H13DRAFT_1858310 [Mycena leptocephala]|nr:hypothetical protein B0H13DRAFT_1858310 [Mycena leptocephala]
MDAWKRGAPMIGVEPTSSSGRARRRGTEYGDGGGRKQRSVLNSDSLDDDDVLSAFDSGQLGRGCVARPAGFADGPPALSAEPAPSAARRLHPLAPARFIPYMRARSRCRRAPRTPPAASVEAVWIAISTPPSTSAFASTPTPTRPSPRRTAPGLAGADAEGSATATRAVFHTPTLHPLRRGSSYRGRIRRISGSAAVQHSNALILRPRSDRASNDASICPHRSPTPTRRGPPCTLSSGVATDANSKCMLSHDAWSPSDWPSYYARRPPVPLRPDLAPATRSHGNCAPLGSPRSTPRTSYLPHAHTSCPWCSVSHGRDDAAPSWPRRRYMMSLRSISTGCLAGPGPAGFGPMRRTRNDSGVVNTVRFLRPCAGLRSRRFDARSLGRNRAIWRPRPPPDQHPAGYALGLLLAFAQDERCAAAMCSMKNALAQPASTRLRYRDRNCLCLQRWYLGGGFRAALGRYYDRTDRGNPRDYIVERRALEVRVYGFIFEVDEKHTNGLGHAIIQRCVDQISFSPCYYFHGQCGKITAIKKVQTLCWMGNDFAQNHSTGSFTTASRLKFHISYDTVLFMHAHPDGSDASFNSTTRQGAQRSWCSRARTHYLHPYPSRLRGPGVDSSSRATVRYTSVFSRGLHRMVQILAGADVLWYKELVEDKMRGTEGEVMEFH